MSLLTHSRFYYGHTVDASNNNLDFDDGSGEITAVLNVGEYTLTDFADEIERAMNEIGNQEYTVTVNRSTRKITISAAGAFDLLVSTGTHLGTSIYSLAGFSGSDKTGALTYTGGSASGYEYATQFILQDHIPSTRFVKASDASVNESASGRVEVVSFGEKRFVEFNIKFVTNRQTDDVIIRNNPTGEDDLIDFMDYLRTKAPIEFMPDEDSPATFESLILETTPEDNKGVGFKLKELYDRGLPGFYETGVLRMRVVT